MTSTDTMKCLPELDRPYERAELFGIKTLTDSELLAVIIKTGTRNRNAVDVSRQLISSFGNLSDVCNASLSELAEFEGIGRVKAIQISAVGELARRIGAGSLKFGFSAKDTDSLGNMLIRLMDGSMQEHFDVLLLDAHYRVIRIREVSVGTLDRALLHPREVFNQAIKESCAAVVLAHNHPSGDVSPSSADLDTTERLMSAGAVLGISVFDHIIVGNGRFYSMRTAGDIKRLENTVLQRAVFLGIHKKKKEV